MVTHTACSKEKKKKCDEARPQCARCAERGLDCVYEPVKPRQRRKRDSLAQAAAAGAGSGTTTATPSTVPAPPSINQLLNNRPQSPVRKFSIFDEPVGSPQQQDWLTGREDHASMFLDDLCESEMMSPLDSTFDTASLMTFPSTDLTTLSPIEFPPEFDEDETGDKFGRNRSNGGKGMDASTRGALVHLTQHKSLYPDLAMISPCPVGSPLNEFSIPAFSEFSDRQGRRALVDHFCNVLSHLIVLREETGNPFQQLVLPLTLKSMPVMNAVYAMTSAHLEYRGVETGEKSLYFHNQAIQGLARLIEHDGKVDKNEVLAAIMLLVYYEVVR